MRAASSCARLAVQSVDWITDQERRVVDPNLGVRSTTVRPLPHPGRPARSAGAPGRLGGRSDTAIGSVSREYLSQNKALAWDTLQFVKDSTSKFFSKIFLLTTLIICGSLRGRIRAPVLGALVTPVVFKKPCEAKGDPPEKVTFLGCLGQFEPLA